MCTASWILEVDIFTMPVEVCLCLQGLASKIMDISMQKYKVEVLLLSADAAV